MTAFLVGAHWALNRAKEELDFWSFMLLCAGGGLIILCLAFGWDHYERKRSRE